MTETKQTVVYIDDELDQIELVRLALRRKGVEVIGTTTGQEGLDAIRRVKPNLVLLDLAMPGMSGLEVYHHIRADDGLAHIPIIIITAESWLTIRVMWQQQVQVAAFIRKPFSIREFDRIVGQSLWNTSGAFSDAN